MIGWGCAAGTEGSGDIGGQDASLSTSRSDADADIRRADASAGPVDADSGTADASRGVCGDGIVTPGEECDDANADPTDRCDGCTVKCLPGERKWPGNNHCYAEFTAQKTTFANAQTACTAKSGYLVSLTSQAEQDFVYGTVIDKNIALPRWLGLTDRTTEGAFKWESGEPLAYTHWRPSQPDDFNASEDCVEMYQVTGEWNDDNCTYEYHYVCEYTPAGQQTPKNDAVESSFVNSVGQSLSDYEPVSVTFETN